MFRSAESVFDLLENQPVEVFGTINQIDGVELVSPVGSSGVIFSPPDAAQHYGFFHIFKIRPFVREARAKTTSSITDSSVTEKAGQYSLTVISTPTNSKVKIMNIKPKYYPGILLTPGKYKICVSHPHYREHCEWAEIKNQNLTIDIELN